MIKNLLWFNYFPDALNCEKQRKNRICENARVLNILYEYCLLILLLGTSVMAKGQVAGFTTVDTAVCAPSFVSFTNTSTGATSYSWDFGNGASISHFTNATSYYTAPGTYTVTLTASNSAGSSDTSSMVIRVYAAPTVNFSAASTNVCPGVFDVFTSTSVSNAWGAMSYNWNFGDGNFRSTASPSYAYPNPGNYMVTLTVTNAPGCVSFLSRPYYINVYTGPSAGFLGYPTSFCVPPSVTTFTNTASGTGPLTYAWIFGDGSTSALANPTHTYTTSSNFRVFLNVTDGHGCVSRHIFPP